MGYDATAPFGYTTPYLRFVREERYFCVILAHLLMQRGDNLQRFLALVSNRLQSEGLPPLGALADAPLQGAEIYVEFAFLRDRWNQFDLDQRERQAARNARKREFLFGLFARVAGLAVLREARLPQDVAAFNERFLGSSGLRITQDIASPALWRVPALRDLAWSVTAEDQARKALF